MFHICSFLQDVDNVEETKIIDIKQAINDSESISTDCQRLLLNNKELSDDKYVCEYEIENETTLTLVLRLLGGRLHGQVMQKSLLYLRPRGFMGMKDEKLHCLMITKLVNTKQIHLLVLMKYFYARMALFHHPRPQTYITMRGAETQRRPFLFPRQ